MLSDPKYHSLGEDKGQGAHGKPEAGPAGPHKTQLPLAPPLAPTEARKGSTKAFGLPSEYGWGSTYHVRAKGCSPAL